MTADFGPCETWPVMWPCDTSELNPSITGSAVEVATEVVWALSGRQFGFCNVKLRPCRRECFEVIPDFLNSVPWSGGFVSPALIGGEWFNLVCGGCGDNCSCTDISEVKLPAPVSEILEVRIDNVVMPTGSYRLDNSQLVVLLNDQWPHCNDLNKDDTEVGTYSITARYGQTIPEGGKWAVGELACELARGMGGGDCRLPRNVTQLVRQGVTIQMPNITELFKEGLTGLYLTDLFIQTWNPSGLRRRSQVYNIDQPKHRRTNT